MKHTKTQERVDYARQLEGEGHTQAEIATRLGISQTAVRQWLDADYAARHKAMAVVWSRLNVDRVRELARARNRLMTREQLDRRCEYARHRYATHPEVRERFRILAAKYRATAQVKIGLALRQALLGHANRATPVYRALITAITGMTPEKFEHRFSGEGEIDHIIPMAAFDLTNPAHLVRSCHPSNLRIISRRENQIKGDSVAPGIDILALPACGGQEVLDLAQVFILRIVGRLARRAQPDTASR